jgi:hypothetical protein
MSKTCSKCKETKPLTEFYRFARAKDGYQARCKVCQNALHTRWVKENPEKQYQVTLRYQKKQREATAARKHAHPSSSPTPEQRVAAAKKWAEDNPERAAELHRNGINAYHRRHPERLKARSMVHDAVRRGELKQEPCRICSNPKSEAHHEDYMKPLEVDWLCNDCHKDLHRQRKKRKATVQGKSKVKLFAGVR